MYAGMYLLFNVRNEFRFTYFLDTILFFFSFICLLFRFRYAVVVVVVVITINVTVFFVSPLECEYMCVYVLLNQK